MRKWIFFAPIIFILGCSEKKSEGYLTTEKAQLYFKKVEEVCNRDNGKLWGKNLYGPLMFIDRNSRFVVANQPDSEGILKEKNGVYTGYFPRELIINFAPVVFGGKFFALSPLPATEDEFRIISGAVHGLFHRFRIASGINTPSYNTNNMDEKEARLWLKLQWKALKKALESDSSQAALSIRDALVFRGSIRELYPNFTTDENRFENNEGLPTFTYTLLSTNSRSDFLMHLNEFYDRIYSMQSYSRSYGFIDGALYATLLYNKGFDFSQITSDDFDLGEAVRKLYNINLPAVCRDVAGSLAVNYGLVEITAEEEKRFNEIQENLQKEVSIFTEKPVVYLELESPYFDFEPEDIHSFDTLGTLYSSMRIADNWGKLTVEKTGCLVASNFKYLRISAKGFKVDKNRVNGDGWHIVLNEGWEIVPVEQNWFAKKRIP